MSILDRILKKDSRYAKAGQPKASVLKLAVPALVVAGGVAASNQGLRDKLFAKNPGTSTVTVVDRNKLFSSSSSTSSFSSGSSSLAGEDQSGKIDPDAFIPEEGIIMRDNRGNIIYKMCRPLTEGQKTAQAEMNAEKARYDKAAAGLTAAQVQNGESSYGSQQYACEWTGPKSAPAEASCPTYKNYAERRDFFRQEYYRLTNQLRVASETAPYNYNADSIDCRGLAANILNQIDPNWKSDPGRSTASTGSVKAGGVQ